MQGIKSIIWFSVRKEIPPSCKLFWWERGTASLPPLTLGWNFLSRTKPNFGFLYIFKNLPVFESNILSSDMYTFYIGTSLLALISVKKKVINIFS